MNKFKQLINETNNIDIPEFPISDIELMNVFDNIDKTNSFNKIKFKIGISSATFVILLIALLLMNYKNNSDNISEQKYLQNNETASPNNVNNNIDNKIESPSNDSFSASNEVNLNSRKSKVLLFETNYAKLDSNKHNIVFNESNKSSDNNSTLGIQSLSLSSEELKKLGIEIQLDNIAIQKKESVNLTRLDNNILNQLKNLKYDISSNNVQVNYLYKIIKNIQKNGSNDKIEIVCPYSFNTEEISENTNPDYCDDFTTSPKIISVCYSKKDAANSTTKYCYITGGEHFNNSKNAQNRTNNWKDALELEPCQDANLGIDIKVKSNINKLISINIPFRTINSSDSKDYFNCLAQIWFYVDKDFANLLPDRYRIPLLDELEVLERVEIGALSPNQACRAIKGAVSYLGLCDIGYDNISSKLLSANPSNGSELKLRIDLKNETKLKIDLFDARGEIVKSLSPFKTFFYGQNQFYYNIENLENGIYFICISDDKCGKSIQKLIINK